MLRALSLATLGLVALAAGPAFAMDPETLVVHVPFAFSVDNVTLPAGDYRVHPLSILDNNVVEIAVGLPEEMGASMPATRSEITAARELASHQQKVSPSAAS